MKIQSGSVNFGTFSSGPATSQLVSMQKFAEAPTVFLSITSLRTDSSQNYTSVTVNAGNVDTDSFNIEAYADPDCTVYKMTVNWLAYL